MNFGRLITAMVTPFNETGQIDYEKTEKLVEYLLANGTEAIVVNGTTGESPTLTHEEKLQLIQYVVKVVNKRVPIIAGTGSNNTYASLELTKQVESFGVDAIMLVCPYYNKPSQRGIYEHFKTIAEATKLPIMLYNIPGRTGVNMLPETIIELAKINNIVCVKEASGNLDAMTKIIRETPSNFSLYSGDDSLTLPILAIGGAGVVSVASHIIGKEMQQMIFQFLSGNVVDAAYQHQDLLPLMQSLFIAPNPTPVKAALNYVGIDTGSVRLPLVPLTETEEKVLKEELYKVKQTYNVG
ncbi:4-hydroxy-tetrahydrodipicolinate synthase [Gracilibacillus marinus]|jgi:4-hydroxy-tetrahydrodipicolinate synthase|uniref:4-hydroxy-tetrahydrodipicolinate synthase n=1 Tax=Gracilibacillus marinus TaxID=630535 RepID=A0ABV8VSX6_9BACI